MVEQPIATEEKCKKETCAACKSALEEVNKNNNNNNNCLIVVDKITFNVFSHYMSTKKSKESGGYLSSIKYGGFRSSPTHLYRISGKTMDGEFKKELYQFMSGMKRVVADNNI